MVNKIPNNVWKVLACPYCQNLIKKTINGAICNHCQTEYNFNSFGSLDLRLKKIKNYKLQFEVGKIKPNESGVDFTPLVVKPKSELDLTEFKEAERLPRDLMSHFPKAKNKNSLMLDLGCGNAFHRKACEYAGFEYVGLDYDSPNALILGDIHSLPFKNNSFDFVLSLAVLQYSRYPFVMMREVNRVLKHNGAFIGSVAFLEPFHKTFYHHTHMGTLNSLQYGGFKIKHIAPSKDWSALVALSSMALFPKMPSSIAKLIVTPMIILHKLWWSMGRLINYKATENQRILNTSGSFAFIAIKQSL